MVGDKAFGIQTKSITAKLNFGNYSAIDKMIASLTVGNYLDGWELP
ncbi:MAG: hypothetical protein ABIK31_07470 [candidate division WOR-3 bacterium]